MPVSEITKVKTIGQLREAIKDVSDDTEIFSSVLGGGGYYVFSPTEHVKWVRIIPILSKAHLPGNWKEITSKGPQLKEG